MIDKAINVADLTCIAECDVGDSQTTSTQGLSKAEARAKSISDNVDAESALYRAIKRMGLYLENAFVIPEDQEARDEHLPTVRRGIQYLHDDIRHDFDMLARTGLPVQHPGEPGHLQAAVDALKTQLGKVSRKTVFTCAGKDLNTDSSTCRGTTFYHLMIRDSALVKDWLKHVSSLSAILREYRTVDTVSDSIFELTKRMSHIAREVCQSMRKVSLAQEQQTVSFCAYLLSHAQSSGVKVIPATSREIWLLLRQAHDVCRDIQAKDGYQWLEGYIEQGIARKRDEQHVVVDVVQLLEEEIETRYSMKVKLPL